MGAAACSSRALIEQRRDSGRGMQLSTLWSLHCCICHKAFLFFRGKKRSVKEYEKSLNLTELLSWQQRGELKRDDHCCEWGMWGALDAKMRWCIKNVLLYNWWLFDLCLCVSGRLRSSQNPCSPPQSEPHRHCQTRAPAGSGGSPTRSDTAQGSCTLFAEWRCCGAFPGWHAQPQLQP